jgi:hypothetical protein
MVDTQKEALEVARKLSMAGTALLAAVTALSVYLLQRAWKDIAAASVTGSDYSMPQWTLYHLNFSFSTMSIAWPVAVGIGVFALCYAARQRDVVWGDFIGSASKDTLGHLDLHLDPLRVDLCTFPRARVALRIFCALPVVALVAHAIAPLVPLALALIATEPKERAFADAGGIGFALAFPSAFSRPPTPCGSAPASERT